MMAGLLCAAGFVAYVGHTLKPTDRKLGGFFLIAGILTGAKTLWQIVGGAA